jgi:formylglycine-generating enzyme required for sulfatase activity
VQFDITWENSWWDPGKHDAAWVFVKYSTDGGGTWNHATLAASGHTAPSGSTIDTPSDSMGVFIYRSGTGSGTVNFSGVQLKWQYGTDGVVDDALDLVKVFAIEMVLVPQAEFAAGSGGTEFNKFTLTTIDTADATVAPSGSGSLGGQAGGFPAGQAAPSNASWPNGFSAFYCMKYEITQEQYRDFLNCLTYDQQNTRTATAPNSAAGTGALSSTNANRNGIDIQTPGVASTTPALYANNLDGDGNFNESVDGQTMACNFLSWMDGCAYADWAALRPMTELEYEKACRGNQLPVANEFAWGTTGIASAAYTLANAGAETEEIATNYATTLGVGNISYTTTDGSINGPLRVGIFAASDSNTTDNRVRSGASFYRIMEMSGNLWERPVTIGDATGRNFTGSLGDGSLSSNGNATNSDWPGEGGGEVTGASGTGFRGGSWVNNSSVARVSDRGDASGAGTGRGHGVGFRCVRQDN